MNTKKPRWTSRIARIHACPERQSTTAEPRALRLRHSLEDLGPIFIKFGQLLSTRRDLLPEDLADELSHLQDNVAPFPAHQAQQIIERALGRAIGEIFADFDPRPLASAPCR